MAAKNAARVPLIEQTLLDYEKLIKEGFADSRWLGLCTYDSNVGCYTAEVFYFRRNKAEISSSAKPSFISFS
jgi:hypothetical protein